MKETVMEHLEKVLSKKEKTNILYRASENSKFITLYKAGDVINVGNSF